MDTLVKVILHSIYGYRAAMTGHRVHQPPERQAIDKDYIMITSERLSLAALIPSGM